MEEIQNKTENPNFRLKAIAELLDGEHHFFIPSYQRGYRWDKKQVEDLLKDICDFANTSKKGDFYCLQPIVVKSKTWKDKDGKDIEGWEVIDGQQRLLSLLLVMKYLRETSEDAKNSSAQFYEIYYQTRPEFDFDKLNQYEDIDSFHAYTAKKTIEQWFSENTIKKSKIVEVLFDNYKQQSKPRSDWEPQVKVIWYVTENQKDIDSIKIFNNLNKGKIRLTNAELIKALFILKTQEYKNDKKVEELNIEEFAYEWNEFESSLQDNRLWYFLANKDYDPATRIDLIFDFLTEKNEKGDDDFAYRRFQNLYDNSSDEFWNSKQVENFTEAWKKVKEVYQTFIYWYENSSIYHYVGYLINNGVSIPTIYEECKGETKSGTISSLQELIRSKFLNYNKEDIDSFLKDENYKECKRILLFFNIETSIKQQINHNSKVKNSDPVTYYKFPFDLYKLNDWDIEHVGSKKDNPLKEVNDKKVWLCYIPDIICDENKKEWLNLQTRAKSLYDKLVEKNKDEGNEFQELYDEIISVIQKNENDSKDTLDNLALLDFSTNRGYGNALFPTKRRKIIEKDMEGVFIPVCTKNLFLKYYSSNDESKSQWKNSWEDKDREAYLKAIHQTIDFILK